MEPHLAIQALDTPRLQFGGKEIRCMDLVSSGIQIRGSPARFHGLVLAVHCTTHRTSVFQKLRCVQGIGVLSWKFGEKRQKIPEAMASKPCPSSKKEVRRVSGKDFRLSTMADRGSLVTWIFRPPKIWAYSLLGAVALVFSACYFDPVAHVGTENQPDGQMHRDGTLWEDAGHVTSCQGTCQPCLALGQSDCETVKGCTWNTEASCAGTCSDCSLFSTEPTCGSQQGCTWHVEWRCEGQCPDCAGLDQEACAKVEGCGWGDLGEGCTGTPHPCENIQDSIACAGVPGCYWDMFNDVCRGTPDSCEGRYRVQCYDGCDWGTIQGCSGTCVPCNAHQDQAACERQQNCTWTQVPPYCDGTCTRCETFLQDTACGSQAGCLWQTSGACQGTCTPCPSLSDQNACQSQPGCIWTDG